MNNAPLYHVTGTDNDHVGEWHTDRSDAEAELEHLEAREGNRRPMFPEYEQLTPGETRGFVIIAVLVGIALAIALWAAVKHQ